MTCSRCGIEVTRYANGKKCRSCYNEYMRDYMSRRYHERRKQAIQALGGKCIDCGTTENLELDHIERSTKLINVSSFTWSDKVYWAEVLDKCTLRCQSCHRKKSAWERSVVHGGGLSGKRNCPCEPCRRRKAEYMRVRYTQGSVSQ